MPVIPVIAPVPLPCKSPVRVEAPVPPFATERSVVSVKALKVGEAVVLTDWSNQSLRVGAPFTVKAKPLTVRVEVKRLVEEAVVLKKLVVVALVAVALPVMVRLPVIVEEA